MTSVLVTGAQGFLGRYLCAALREARPGDLVIGLGRSVEAPGFFVRSLHDGSQALTVLPSGVSRRLDAGYLYQRADVSDTAEVAAVLERHRPQQVFHLAGALRPSPSAAVDGRNAIASLLNAIAASPGTARRLVMASSGAVYGAAPPAALPLRESSVCIPVDPYGTGKLRDENLAIAAGQRLSLDVVVARLFNLIGPGQDDVHACGRFAALVASGAPTLRVRSLHATRDFIDVRDAARALLILGARGVPGTTCNVGSGEEVAMSSVLENMIALAGYRGEVVVDLPEANLPNVPRHVADIARLRGLGFAPRHRLTESLRDMLAYQVALPSPETAVPSPA